MHASDIQPHREPGGGLFPPTRREWGLRPPAALGIWVWMDTDRDIVGLAYVSFGGMAHGPVLIDGSISKLDAIICGIYK